MDQTDSLSRYAEITEKNPREIVMLRGTGCTWKRCRFCDYHLDFSLDKEANYTLNSQVLSHVTGKFQKLEVINSGSFTDLDTKTLCLIENICKSRQISVLHLECHWQHRQKIAALRRRFAANCVSVKLKTGVETFDSLVRECYLNKGIDTDSPKEIASFFDEACLLQGIPGQTKESMERDIITGLTYFERICVNIMCENSSHIKPDPAVITVFVNELYPKYKNNPRIDILLSNTDFGVGGKKTHA